jgi:hypothetical protein
MECFKKLFCFPFTKVRSKNANITVNNESKNSGNLNKDLDLYEQMLSYKAFGLCPKCNKPNSHYYWCKECYSKKFKQNFSNWTSKNDNIDKFIQEFQLLARNRFDLLEWIPYNRLRNIKFLAQGGFSTVYRAVWLDGLIDRWDYKKQDWEREIDKLDEQDYKDAINPEIKNPLKSNEKYGYHVVLKSLNDSSTMDGYFLNEVCSYYTRSYILCIVTRLGI